jgi:hypothetical protein
MSILSRVRHRLSSSQSEADPHQWRLPSVYSTGGDRDTLIPHPDIVRNAFIPNDPTLGTTDNSLSYPDVSHAAVHLALLECFRKLRLSASDLDVQFERPPEYSEDLSDGEEEVLPHRLPDSEKWDLLRRLAGVRFNVWWMSIDHVLNHAAAYTHHAGDKATIQLTKDYLPPLDVLLVWYSFMLDDTAYQAACRDRESFQLSQLCFPWPAIRDVIDLDTLKFELPRAAEKLFFTISNQSADILSYQSSPPAYTESRTNSIEADLFAAVKEQERFIDDAHQLLWIRSPALSGSLERSSREYLKAKVSGTFSEAMESQSCFGLELIWKTHKLYPLQYKLFQQGTGARGLERYEAKVTSPNLEPQTSSGSSSKDAVEPQCYCWTCERIRDDLPAFAYDLTTSASSAESMTSPSPYPMRLLTRLSSDQLRSIQDDIGFYRAVEKARRRHQPLPTRPLTSAEKAAEKAEAKKRADAGLLPDLMNEYTETFSDGTRRVRKALTVARRFM